MKDLLDDLHKKILDICEESSLCIEISVNKRGVILYVDGKPYLMPPSEYKNIEKYARFFVRMKKFQD